jgi:hypothetical protein
LLSRKKNKTRYTTLENSHTHPETDCKFWPCWERNVNSRLKGLLVGIIHSLDVHVPFHYVRIHFISLFIVIYINGYSWICNCISEVAMKTCVLFFICIIQVPGRHRCQIHISVALEFAWMYKWLFLWQARTLRDLKPLKLSVPGNTADSEE